MGLKWVEAEANYEGKDTKKEESRYGTTTPNFTPEYRRAVDDYRGQLNPQGANQAQQEGLDFLKGRQGGARRDIDTPNSHLAWYNSQLGQRVQGGYEPYTSQGAHLLGDAPTVEGRDITAQEAAANRGSEFMNDYKNPFQSDVINASLSDYDVGGDRALNAARAGRDASGAFGSRAAIGDAVLGGEIARGRGALSAGLNYEGFNTAAGLGMQDANRFTGTSQFNAGQRQGADMFNSEQAFNTSAANAGLLDSRERFNVGSEYQNDAQKIGAIDKIRDTLLDQANLTQAQIDNVVTANGIDLEAAQSLFAAGTITQQQLDDIVRMEAAGNSRSFTENTNSKMNEDTYGGSVKAGLGI